MAQDWDYGQALQAFDVTSEIAGFNGPGYRHEWTRRHIARVPGSYDVVDQR